MSLSENERSIIVSREIEKAERTFDDTFEEEDFSDMDKELYSPEEAYEMTMKDIKAIYDHQDAI